MTLHRCVCASATVFALLLASACPPKQVAPEWLQEQKQAVDKICSCADPLDAAAANDDAYFAQLTSVQKCFFANNVYGIMLAKTPSGLESGLRSQDLWNNAEVRFEKERFIVCQNKLNDRLGSLNPEDKRRIMLKAKP